MGREVRHVPLDWEHPRTDDGDSYIPLFEGHQFKPRLKDWEEHHKQWMKGFVANYGKGPEWKSRFTSEVKSETFEEWHGEKPLKEDYMPEWDQKECTHIQMYETCTEGTPISPTMDTPENLARWLADNGASSFGNMTASYEAWLATIKAGSSIGMCYSPTTGVVSGVEASLNNEDERNGNESNH